MPISRTAPLLALLLSVLLAGVWQLRPATPQVAVVPTPVWPATDAAGLPLLSVYEGRLPCPESCDSVRTALALYGNGAPLSFWLGRIYGNGSGQRSEVPVLLTTTTGIPRDPAARVLTLGAGAPEDLRRLWQLSPNILIPLDSELNPVPGTATWGNTLSRTH